MRYFEISIGNYQFGVNLVSTSINIFKIVNKYSNLLYDNINALVNLDIYIVFI